MTPRFNKQAAYGTIHPAYNGAFFTQGGNYFDNEGNFLFASPEEAAKAEAKPAQLRSNSRFGTSQLAPVAPAPSLDEEDRRELEALRAEKIAREAEAKQSKVAAITEASENAVEQPGKPDLKAWARNEAVYPFYQITRYVKATYPHVVLSNTKTVLEGLVAAGVITKEDALRS